MKKVLITGGAGFIGSNLIELLNDYEVTIIDNLNEQVHGQHPLLEKVKNTTLVVADIRNKKDILSHVVNTDIIIHMVSETGTYQSENEITRYTDVNICGTSVILDILNNEKHNVKKLILTSSRSVYGEGTNKKETDSLNPISVYAITKRVQEDLIINSCPIPYTVLRFQNVYGEGQSLINPYTGIISIFMVKCFSNEKIEVYDNNLATRDFIHISDVVKSILLMIEDNNISRNNIYNIGSGTDVTILFVAELIKKITNSSSNIIVTPYHRKGDVQNVSADVSKFKKDFNWNSEVDIQEGLERLVRYVQL